MAAAILSAASLDGIEPVFEAGIGVDSFTLYACAPATRYDHLILAKHLTEFTWGYNMEDNEVHVNIDIVSRSTKRRKTG